MKTRLVSETLRLNNPFDAPVYYKEKVTSTMDEARLLTNEPSGTVIAAGEQSAGRGRMGRPWKMNTGENLPFTVLLRYGSIKAIPVCLTLRAGLAVSGAIEDFAGLFRNPPREALHLWQARSSPLAGRIFVKWPNDIMLLDKEDRGRKAVGILAEAEDGNVYLGIGVNIAQKSFPPELEQKACSIAQILSEETDRNDAAALLAEKRFTLLELILSRLYEELTSDDSLWRRRLEDRLYLKGRKVSFFPGLPEEYAEKAVEIEGILQGVGDGGEICITADSGELLSFTTGELKVYT